MTQAEILTEIRRLPLEEQVGVIQFTAHIVQRRLQLQPEAVGESQLLPLEEAAELLLDDYLNDEELTAFAALDGEPVHG